jgi:hypothetical protein
MKLLTYWSLTALSLMVAASAQAEIYEWHGNDGKINYSDRKPGADVGTESIKPNISRPGPAPVSAIPAAQEAPIEDVATNETDDDAAFFKRNCEQGDIRLASLQRPRINKVNADGTRSRMSEEWRQAQLLEAEAAIKKYCK